MIQSREFERGGAAGHELAPVVIEARGLRKAYGQLQAVRGVNLTVRRGEVFCLLGPNGAGKTSVGGDPRGIPRRERRARPGCSGFRSAARRGQSRELRERVGIVLQSCGVQPDLTVAELVEMYGRYHRHPRPVDEVLELVELEAKRDERAGKLSGRPAPAARPGARARRRPGADLPRRADDRLRPGRAPPGLVGDPVAVRARQDDLPHHALHGRGPAPGRPRRGDARGRDHRRGRARRARRPRPPPGRDPLHAARGRRARRHPRRAQRAAHARLPVTRWCSPASRSRPRI